MKAKLTLNPRDITPKPSIPDPAPKEPDLLSQLPLVSSQQLAQISHDVAVLRQKHMAEKRTNTRNVLTIHGFKYDAFFQEYRATNLIIEDIRAMACSRNIISEPLVYPQELTRINKIWDQCKELECKNDIRFALNYKYLARLRYITLCADYNPGPLMKKLECLEMLQSTNINITSNEFMFYIK